MKCPRCSSEVRPSKKYPEYYLCDTCKKRFPESAIIKDNTDDDFTDYTLFDTEDAVAPQASSSLAEENSSNSSPAKKKSQITKASSSKKSKGRKSKKKKGGPLKIILIILLILIIAVVALFVSGVIDKDLLPFKNTEKNVTPEDDDNATDDTSDQKTYALGEIATINDISIQATDYEESTGDEWAAPEEGNVFVFVNLNITNQSEKDITVSSMASFESYCNDVKLDYSVNAFTALATNTDRQQMDGSVVPGSSLDGYLCLEVPSDWTDLEIHYADQVWKDEGVIFRISK
ncbi:MAG: DUF4352 domain-containing protein [Bariatricus sp.]|nr:DUF4352 domain-containing protein [Bariatricus sp.]